MKLRVMVFGAHGSHRTESSIVRAARSLGHAAALVDADRWRRLGPLGWSALRRLVRRWAPDQVLLTRYAAALDDETLGAVTAGRGAALWFFDLVQRPHERILRLARAAGAMYVTCPSQIELYRASGIPTVRFLPQAADPGIDRPARRVPPSYRCDVSFVGSGQYSYRHELLERLAGACDLQVRGPGWDGMAGRLPVAGGPVLGRRFAQAVGGAAVSLGAFAFASQRDQRACASNRMWKVMACGGFYLGARAAGLEHFAHDGEHCAWYDSAEEAVARVRQYLAAPEARAAIAEAGRRHTLAEHTYADRVRRILDGRDYPVP